MTSKLPIVTIAGRQNVGKSTLFNALVKERIAIVDTSPGLTRDILSYSINYRSVAFNLSDTPGLDLLKRSELSGMILENARQYLEKSSVIIFLMESPSPQAFDIDLADLIRKLSRPTIIAVNKIDNDKLLENISYFYEMGFDDILPISALKRKNLNLLLDRIVESLPLKKRSISEPDIKIAIVGRPNSGKSTLLNSLIGYNRTLVSDLPGTTLDSVDEDFTFNNIKIRIIDTAGLKRKRRIKNNIEFYSHNRTIRSIKRSDVVIHLIDAEIGLTETDKKISDEILKAYKPLIIAVNKWDILSKDQNTFNEFKDRLIFKFYKSEDFPIISISALKKTRIHKLIKTAIELKELSKKKIGTPKLNKIISMIQNSYASPEVRSKIKILYATQIKNEPPHFKLFVNNTKLLKNNFLRFLEKALRKELGLKGIPIILDFEGKKK